MNNEIEYNALVITLQLAKVYGVTNLSSFCSSQLVVGKVLGEFEANEARLKVYHALVLRLVDGF